MKKIQPTYSAYTREDMDALFGTRPATSTAQSISCPDGYAAYIEYYSSDEACGVGYNDGLAVGTTGKMNVGWVDMNDTSKYFRFVINYTVE